MTVSGKIKILHAESQDYCPQARAVLDSFASVDYMNIDREEMLKRIADYDAVIVRLRNSVDREMIQKASRLKVIASPTTGTNHIDEAVAGARKVQIISLKGQTQFLRSVYSTAEHTFGLILALVRQLPFAQADVLDGHWRNEYFRGHELHGKVLGIVGYGRLGAMVARIGKGFGMRILACDIAKRRHPRYVEFGALATVLAKSDIVSVHVPLNERTKELISRECFQKMKKGSFFINTSRGEIVDETALLKALEKGHLAGAALDVLAGEEKNGFNAARHPLVRYAGKHRNLIITPHIGGAAIEAVEKTDVFIARKIKHYFKGLSYERN